jgi:anti-sigma regulatory factor (Ser/Thr protein kinase)
MRFDEERLFDLRNFVRTQAAQRNVDPTRIPDLVLAVDEAVTNSIRYGGGAGVLRIWSQDRRVICEVRDHGVIDEPLAGRVVPDPVEPGGFGLWLANQLCDLVQIRSSSGSSSVRLHIYVT